eukprot:m.228527 g.228527  ORF g.228527 m.228527 type:complete len:505 (+) comp11755_c0_seq1:41-1555(+)
MDGEDDFDPTIAAIRSDEWDSVSVPTGVVDHVPSYVLPEPVKKYLVFFRQQLGKSVAEVEFLYEAGHKRLTEKYFNDQSWPSADTIAPLVQNDATFLLLYRELFFRHVYAKLQPTVEQRIESFRNYEALFKFFLESKEAAKLELPERWLWDMIDEYIYQYQSFTQFRSKLSSRTDSEKAVLRENTKAWSVLAVLTTLHALIDKSGIKAQLSGAEDGTSALRILGYFAIIGLLRLHTLLGDYHLALKSLDAIELSKRALYTRVPACQISLYYYLGACYLLTRRYQDAVRTLASILVYIVRTPHAATRLAAGYDNLTKKRDQLLSLLAIAVTLSPHRIDEAVHSQLLEKCGDRMQRMRSGDEAAIEELFSFGCPKFLSPVAPNYDAPQGSALDPYRYQLRIFLQDAAAHAKLGTSRSYLRLYSTMPLAKLASFLGLKPDELRVHLHAYKHRFSQVAWTSGPAASGARVFDDDVDFYVDGDMIHIADVKVARCYGEYFIHQINKLAA